MNLLFNFLFYQVYWSAFEVEVSPSGRLCSDAFTSLRLKRFQLKTFFRSELLLAGPERHRNEITEIPPLE